MAGKILSSTVFAVCITPALWGDSFIQRLATPELRKHNLSFAADEKYGLWYILKYRLFQKLQHFFHYFIENEMFLKVDVNVSNSRSIWLVVL